MPVDINIESFEGPLDLLLHLIQKEELPITEISLSKIADQYLEQLEHVQDRSSENLAQFLVVAAQLLLLKSRALLPQDEQEDVADEDLQEAQELAQRLKTLQKFREVSGFFRERYARPERSFEPRFVPAPEVPFSAEGVTTSRLRDLLVAKLQSVAKERALLQEEHLEATVTIEEKVEEIRAYMKKGDVAFSTLLSSARTKADVVVTFLSTLELMKQQEISVEQGGSFASISIRARS